MCITLCITLSLTKITYYPPQGSVAVNTAVSRNVSRIDERSLTFVIMHLRLHVFFLLLVTLEAHVRRCVQNRLDLSQLLRGKILHEPCVHRHLLRILRADQRHRDFGVPQHPSDSELRAAVATLPSNRLELIGFPLDFLVKCTQKGEVSALSIENQQEKRKNRPDPSQRRTAATARPRNRSRNRRGSARRPRGRYDLPNACRCTGPCRGPSVRGSQRRALCTRGSRPFRCTARTCGSGPEPCESGRQYPTLYSHKYSVREGIYITRGVPGSIRHP